MSEKLVSVTSDLKNGIVSFSFEKEFWAAFSVHELDAEVKAMLATHGLKSKLVDCYAGYAKEAAETGMSPIDVVKARVDALWEALFGGSWTTRRETAGISTGTLAEALRRLSVETGQPKPIDECIAVVSGMEKTQRANIEKNPHVARIILDIRAEELAAKTDDKAAEPDDILSGLFGAPEESEEPQPEV